ncbi:uncharacterized protein VTP21DRAFT_8912 [Calcarisporiella thermophila]|uniref:uncharacterized protein n=1 Tax=Calcarisporiella thermophila TaxID=911321 RepID=UPI003741F46D
MAELRHLVLVLTKRVSIQTHVPSRLDRFCTCPMKRSVEEVDPQRKRNFTPEGLGGSGLGGNGGSNNGSNNHSNNHNNSNANSGGNSTPRNSAPSTPSHPSAHRSPNPLHSSHRFTGCSRIDEYEMEGKLGEGTFGVVHKAKRKSTGKMVALKRILIHKETDGVPITALREIKILKRLQHHNIVPLIDIAIQKGDRAQRKHAQIYMVFPYMEHDLAGLLSNPKVNFTIPQIKLYLKQLIEGVLYLHQNNIYHRDIKAANLLINNEGVLQIADFGLSRPFEEGANRAYTSNVVTLWYRPPELLLEERRYTEAIDIWGVGCIMGEMLRGKPLFPGSTVMEQLERIFRLCGSPTDETWPGWRDLPGAKEVRFKQFPRMIKDEFARFGSAAVDLLEKLLTLNPKQRGKAFDALDHDWFWTEPLPAEPKSLPSYPPSHEYDVRKEKEKQAAGQERQGASRQNASRASAGIGR